MKRWKTALAGLLAAVGLMAALPTTAAAADEKIEKALEWGIEVAENDRHGYSQTNRFGPDYDCSSFVSTALMEGGFELDGVCSTYTLKAALTELGFECYHKGEVELERGDILLDPAAHVEFYLGDGMCLAAHRDYDWRSGDSTGKEIAVRGESWCSFCRRHEYVYILRYPEAPEPEAEAEATETASAAHIFYLPMEQIEQETAMREAAEKNLHSYSLLAHLIEDSE